MKFLNCTIAILVSLLAIGSSNAGKITFKISHNGELSKPIQIVLSDFSGKSITLNQGETESLEVPYEVTEMNQEFNLKIKAIGLNFDNSMKLLTFDEPVNLLEFSTTIYNSAMPPFLSKCFANPTVDIKLAAVLNYAHSKTKNIIDEMFEGNQNLTSIVIYGYLGNTKRQMQSSHYVNVDSYSSGAVKHGTLAIDSSGSFTSDKKGFIKNN